VLIVAVHDVAPSTLDDVRWLLSRLDAAGVRRRVLKVVPAEPGASPAQLDELGDLVASEAALGSEVVQHGWSHRATGALRGRPVDRVRARLFAGSSAEFLTLSADEVEHRVRDGLARLTGWGAAVSGFCPPAWLATPDLAPAARRAGLRYLLTLRGMRDLVDERWVTLPPIGYMGAGGLQETLVAAGGWLVSGPLRRAIAPGVHRVFLHPQGARSSRACARVLDRVATLAGSGPSGTYRELLDA
jgi:uncharacterized protein